MKNIALNYLNKDVVKHIGMIECVKHDKIEYLYCAEDGVFLYDESAKVHMIATDSAEVCAKAFEMRESLPLLVCHNEFEYDIAKEKFGLCGLNKCYQVVWLNEERPKLTGVCEVKKLEPTEENINIIYDNYTLSFTKEHIKYIMEYMGMYGAYVDGKIVGFMGRHEERSLGLLEIFPEYRRRGIATELENYMLNMLVDNGEVPYAHIIYTNEKSLAMHVKRGFTFSKTFVYWLFKGK